MGLIEVDDNGKWRLKGVEWKQIAPGAVITKKIWEKLYGALWKLKDYENTRVDPDGIRHLMQRRRNRPASCWNGLRGSRMKLSE